VVARPAALDRISSPVAARGQAATFEGNVVVEVREDGMLAGTRLGQGFVTGRGDGVLGDFAGDIAFDAPTKAAGAVVFFERSAADGVGVVRATVVRVAF
ncbi:MAG TPA: Gmad2 immunoglobulin-like domain-containing protein, partial [Acidimicrobiales bacterium]